MQYGTQTHGQHLEIDKESVKSTFLTKIAPNIILITCLVNKLIKDNYVWSKYQYLQEKAQQ